MHDKGHPFADIWIEMHELPRFNSKVPLDALPSPLYEIAQWALHETGAHPANVLTDILACASTATHGCFELKLRTGKPMPLSLITIMLMKTGGSKGRCYDYCMGPIIDRDVSRLGNMQTPGSRSTGDGLLLISNPTYAALMDRLRGHERCVSFQAEEGKTFFRGQVADVLDVVTQLWSGNAIVGDEKHGETMLALKARFSCGVRIQDDIFWPIQLRNNDELRSIGFCGRAIVGWAEMEPHEPTNAKLSPAVFKDPMPAYAESLNSILDEADGRREAGSIVRIQLQLSPEAERFTDDVKRHIDTSLHHEYAEIQDAARRAWENTVRIAGIFHVVCGCQGKISVEMAERAWQIVRWSLGQFQLIFVEREKCLVQKKKDEQAARKADQACELRKLHGEKLVRCIAQLCHHHRAVAVPTSLVREFCSIGAAFNSVLIQLEMEGVVMKYGAGRKQLIGIHTTAWLPRGVLSAW